LKEYQLAGLSLLAARAELRKDNCFLDIVIRFFTRQQR
jgi:hypothetical protein